MKVIEKRKTFVIIVKSIKGKGFFFLRCHVKHFRGYITSKFLTNYSKI